DWVFGDFQSLKPNPDEHRIQPIGASQLGTPFSSFTQYPRGGRGTFMRVHTRAKKLEETR
ncbi:hypothetical protein N0427_02475, partial [Pseudomonas aeruginosa]|nr:hypothetical protein [Pseudomonas aeruginosa]MCS9006063.1 hypothetical protein [Pseudomonas aeruginosa]